VVETRAREVRKLRGRDVLGQAASRTELGRDSLKGIQEMKEKPLWWEKKGCPKKVIGEVTLLLLKKPDTDQIVRIVPNLNGTGGGPC